MKDTCINYLVARGNSELKLIKEKIEYYSEVPYFNFKVDELFLKLLFNCFCAYSLNRGPGELRVRI